VLQLDFDRRASEDKKLIIKFMTYDHAQHNRTMNLNAHFAWAMGLWGSAEAARADGNLMLAPIGYYYSTFHAAYAYLNAVPGIEPATFELMGHSQLSNLIERHLSVELRGDFDRLRDVRETINYLGFGEPTAKLRIVRGNPLYFVIGDKQYSFVQIVDMAKDRSHAFITGVLDKLAGLKVKAVDTVPIRGDVDENWLQGYMQEDMLLGVMSDYMRGRVLSLACGLLV
jgi:hypothetical protein